MENETLTYAKAEGPRVRGVPLALGAGLVAFAGMVMLVQAIVTRNVLGFATRDWIIFASVMTESLCILAGVVLLGMALPPLRRGIRWKWLACLVIAGMMLGVLAFGWGWILGWRYLHWLAPMPVGFAVLSWISRAMSVGVVICGMGCLITLGARLGRVGLGILGACGLLPQLLSVVMSILVYGLSARGFSPLSMPGWMDLTLTVVGFAGYGGVIVVWGTVAIVGVVRGIGGRR